MSKTTPVYIIDASNYYAELRRQGMMSDNII